MTHRHHASQRPKTSRPTRAAGQGSPASRRQFVRTVAAGAVFAPAALAAEDSRDTGPPQPDPGRGEVLRTSGELAGEHAVLEPPRRVPIAGTSDVIVCGGGPAGIGAALGAARAGASVRLIEVAGCLGGIWTAGLLTKIIDGLADRGTDRRPGRATDPRPLHGHRRRYRPRQAAPRRGLPSQLRLRRSQPVR